MSAAATAVYTRISRDREGAGLGVERQLAEIQERMAATGESLTGASVVVYSDNDLSAYSGKPRPGYERMLEDVRAGKVRTLWAWHTDRLHRNNAELESFIAAIDAGGVEVRTAKAGKLDLATPSGRLAARTLGSIAVYESEHRGERIKAKHRQLAEQGGFQGGRRRFGFTEGMTELEPVEAEVVRELAKRILAGESQSALARDLNARGIRTSQGNEWGGSQVSKMMQGAHLAGLRAFNGEVMGKAQWPAILERNTWEAVRATLTAKRGTLTWHNTARRHWLTGLATCGACGGKVRGTITGMGKHRRASYKCETNRHVHRPAELVDELVVLAVGEWLANVAPDVFTGDDDDERERIALEIDSLKVRRRELAVNAALGGDVELIAIARETIDAQVHELGARLAAIARPVSVLDGLIGKDDASLRLRALPLDARRAVMTAVPARVTLMPSAYRGARFDPDTVVIDWQ